MDLTTIQSILEIGENIAVEFKRCGNGIESDTYETVCSFLNRFGGDIFLGVLNDGTVLGITKNAISDMVKNFIKVVSNPALFSPTVYLVPEKIEYDENRTIIHIHVPPSAEVHSYKKIIYDRVDDADVNREFTNSYTAKFVIEKERMFVENANRAASDRYITEDNLEPIPKNPIIASFFRNIGYADQLGSGVRNLFIVNDKIICRSL